MISRRLFLILFLIVFTCGCGDEYGAEKKMWYAQREAQEIIANPDMTPSGQVEIVANNFRRIIEDRPEWNGSIKARFILVDIYLAKKDYAKAKEELEKTVEAYKDNKIIAAKAKSMIAGICELENNWSQAQAVYEEIIDKYFLTPQGYVIPLTLVEGLLKQNNTAGAEAILRRVIPIYQQNSRSGTTPDQVKLLAIEMEIKTKYLLSSILERSGRWLEAKPLLETILKDYPYTPEGMTIPLYLAFHYSKENNEIEAGNAFAEAVRYYNEQYNLAQGKPLGKALLNLLGITYIKQKLWVKAIEVQEKIIKEYPNDRDIPLSLLNIAMLYDKELKDKKKAEEYYKKIIEQYPSERLAKAAKTRMEALYKEEN